MNRMEQLNAETFRDYRHDELVRAAKQARLTETQDADDTPRRSFTTVFATLRARAGRMLRRRPAGLAQKAA